MSQHARNNPEESREQAEREIGITRVPLQETQEQTFVRKWIYDHASEGAQRTMLAELRALMAKNPRANRVVIGSPLES